MLHISKISTPFSKSFFRQSYRALMLAGIAFCAFNNAVAAAAAAAAGDPTAARSGTSRRTSFTILADTAVSNLMHNTRFNTLNHDQKSAVENLFHNAAQCIVMGAYSAKKVDISSNTRLTTDVIDLIIGASLPETSLTSSEYQQTILPIYASKKDDRKAITDVLPLKDFVTSLQTLRTLITATSPSAAAASAAASTDTSAAPAPAAPSPSPAPAAASPSPTPAATSPSATAASAAASTDTSAASTPAAPSPSAVAAGGSGAPTSAAVPASGGGGGSHTYSLNDLPPYLHEYVNYQVGRIPGMTIEKFVEATLKSYPDVSGIDAVALANVRKQLRGY